VLQLLSRLGDPQVSFEELEHLVGSDPALTYKLLRYINSSKFSLRHKIESLRQVVVLLGIQQVRTLAMLIFLAGIFQKSNEILTNAMIRALLCERLGRLCHHRDPHTFFTTDHYRGYPTVLVRLDSVSPDDLRDVFETAWRNNAPKRLIKAYDESVGS
jgi:c-di-GMP-related signal transduction protein